MKSCCEDCENHFDHVIMEVTEYQGKKVKLNDPIRTSENPNKKFKVYVKNEKGKVVVVRFGDPNMGINRDDPERRKLHFVQDTIVMTLTKNGRQDTGVVISGVLQR